MMSKSKHGHGQSRQNGQDGKNGQNGQKLDKTDIELVLQDFQTNI